MGVVSEQVVASLFGASLATEPDPSAIRFPNPLSALIAAGADVDLADEEGWTPLIAAASRAAWSTMDLLIAAGAACNHPGVGGKTRHLYTLDAARQKRGIYIWRVIC